MACAVKTALLSCVVEKAYRKSSIANSRRTSCSLTGDTARAANTDEVKELRCDAMDQKEVERNSSEHLQLA